MDEATSAHSPHQAIDRRIRHAMRILENEQTPLPTSAEVAERVGLSVFHFVRLFAAQVGWTPQDYGRSLIMMHAASRIRYSTDPIKVVARDFGYAKQATFNRAFTQHHGVAPVRWRAQAQAVISPVSGDGVRLETVPALRCFARRYLGPRELTGAQWADFVPRLPPDLRDRPRIGFAYDDPRVTPPGRIRHDCAVVVGDGLDLPEEMAEDGFEVLVSPAGLWAVVDVGRREIANGYRAVLDGWFQRRPDYALEGDPHLERYGKASGGEDVVSVSLRVRPVEEDGSWNMPVVVPVTRV
ncbi:AraC family transcriptional regulator [Lichenibacterium minor]|uniref:AraC family transcriptional regulator n=1 Tax=Lichenibacterium minor TaxID=2316528 RepID=UPI0013EC751A|nr:AraC family transcriptional regulator [Lichenibacterium minor]